MQKRIVFYILIVCSLVSACEFDYNLDDKPNTFTPKVVLNSFITPGDFILVLMSWSKHYTSLEYPSTKPKGIAKLYENDKLVKDTTIDQFGHIRLFYNVKAGKNYKIVVDVEDHGIVEAETTIPYAGSAQGEFLEKHSTAALGYSHSFYHTQIDEISTPNLIRAVWIRAEVAYKFKNEHEDLQLFSGSMMNKIYSNNLYVDNFNIGTEYNDDLFEGNISASGGILYYTRSIRIPYQLIELSQPLTMAILCEDSITTSVQVAPEHPNEDVTIPISDVVVEVIYPSDDFDKYVKGVYRQSELIFDTSFPLFAETVYVHSNVKNGLGIFAGYNSITLELPIKELDK